MDCVESLVRFLCSLHGISISIVKSEYGMILRLTQACTPVDCMPKIVCSTATPLRYGSGEKPTKRSVFVHQTNLFIITFPVASTTAVSTCFHCQYLAHRITKYSRRTERSYYGSECNIGSLASELLSHVQASGVDESFIP
jgi:hypothetical protein